MCESPLRARTSNVKLSKKLNAQLLHLQQRQVAARASPVPVAPPHPKLFHMLVPLLTFEPALRAKGVGVVAKSGLVAMDDEGTGGHFGPCGYDAASEVHALWGDVPRQYSLRGGFEAQGFVYAGHEVW